jgi:hypothetical protein
LETQSDEYELLKEFRDAVRRRKAEHDQIEFSLGSPTFLSLPSRGDLVPSAREVKQRALSADRTPFLDSFIADPGDPDLGDLLSEINQCMKKHYGS